MVNRGFRSDCKGQVLIVTGLLVSLLLLTTALYVIEIEKDVPVVDANQNNPFLAYKQSVRSTMISALANKTGDGNSEILAADMVALKTAILQNSYQAMTTMDYNLLNSGSYSNGFWISWGTNGQGISSAFASFDFASSSNSATSSMQYDLNVTSEVRLSGSYRQINETSKQVTLTINVLNEGKAALAQNFSFSYQNATEWISVDAPGITNFGDGTYTVSFPAETTQLNEPLNISCLCQDQRSIFVEANLTCTST